MTDPETSPLPGADSNAAVDADSDADSDAAVDAAAAGDNDELEGLSSADYTVAFSPRQVAVGLAIVAGLVAVLAGRRRGRRRSGGDA